MIELKFGLFWSGAPLSYLRYLTFKSLRHFHPNSKIILCVTDKFNNSGYKWGDEKQDFENKECVIDYMDKLKNLDIEVIKTEKYSKYPSNFQSDWWRWEWLRDCGGFYLDTDQIILKSFETLPLDNNFIYSGYAAKSCGYYTPVGVIGAYDSEVVRWMNDLLPQLYNPNNYNSIGPFGLKAVLQCHNWKDKMFNAPSNYFYPVPDSFMVPEIYEGRLKLSKETISLHWFGGHPLSQEFNRKYTEEFSKISNDSISLFLRENAII